MTAEPSTQQRPWAAVARFPQDHDPVKFRAHWGAMIVANDKAYAAVDFDDDAAQRAAWNRYLRPTLAAFCAAAQSDTESEWTIERLDEAMQDGATVVEEAHAWLEAAGINPDEIAPAT